MSSRMVCNGLAAALLPICLVPYASVSAQAGPTPVTSEDAVERLQYEADQLRNRLDGLEAEIKSLRAASFKTAEVSPPICTVRSRKERSVYS